MSCCRGRGRRAESWLGRAEEPQAGVGSLAPGEEEGSTPARPPSSLAAPRKDGAPLRRGVALPISKMAAGEGGGWWGWSRPRGWRGLPAAGARRGGMVARGLRALRGALRAIAAAERRFSTRPARAPAMDYQVRAGGGEGSGSSRRVLPRGGEGAGSCVGGTGRLQPAGLRAGARGILPSPALEGGRRGSPAPAVPSPAAGVRARGWAGHGAGTATWLRYRAGRPDPRPRLRGCPSPAARGRAGRRSSSRPSFRRGPPVPRKPPSLVAAPA